jgi:hypothetical protein
MLGMIAGHALLTMAINVRCKKAFAGWLTYEEVNSHPSLCDPTDRPLPRGCGWGWGERRAKFGQILR